jgi:RNA polymerase sigma-70 factor, ECF subfamily
MLRRNDPSMDLDMLTATVDIGLVCAAQRGDRVAADRLVREHDGWIRGVIYGVTGRPQHVEDIAQQVWTQVWERLPSLTEPQRLRSWLYAVARNAAIDYSQAQQRRANPGLDGVADSLSDKRSISPQRCAARNEDRTHLLRAVEALPQIYREPFVLRHVEDWTYQQIASLLNLPVETVETRLVRARRLLREMLSGKLES